MTTQDLLSDPHGATTSRGQTVEATKVDSDKGNREGKGNGTEELGSYISVRSHSI